MKHPTPDIVETLERAFVSWWTFWLGVGRRSAVLEEARQADAKRKKP